MTETLNLKYCKPVMVGNVGPLAIITLHGGWAGSGLATANSPLLSYYLWHYAGIAIISYKQLTPSVRGENY